MNEPLPIGTVAIIVLTGISSFLGFRDSGFRDKHLFSAREILAGKQWHRLFTAAFLHADWNHLLLNMVSLYLFGRDVELFLGIERFLAVYLAAIVGGGLLSLWLHRHHEYHAYGASGGVCGVIFSYIFLFPGSDIIMFPLPVSIPAWLYAILFVIGSFLALQRQADNIGHDAHLGGAIIGLWTTAALQPWIVRLQPRLFLAVSALAVALFVYLVKNPVLLPLSAFRASRLNSRPTTRKTAELQDGSSDLDAILEKISKDGMDSLSRKERDRLSAAAKKFQRRAALQKPDSGSPT